MTHKESCGGGGGGREGGGREGGGGEAVTGITIHSPSGRHVGWVKIHGNK